MRAAWWVAALGMASVVSPDARACSCLSAFLVAPGEGATNVPLNTAIWLRGTTAVPQGTSLSEGNSTTVVPLTCESLGQASRCRPAEPLKANTLYRVEFSGTTFTTGGWTDTEAPAPPAEVRRRYYSRGDSSALADSCDTGKPSGVVALTLRGSQPILVVDAADRNGADFGTAPVTEIKTPISDETEAWVGTWACTYNRPTKPGDTFPLSAGVFDVAGNFSGWVRLEDAHIPPSPPAPPGCSHAHVPVGAPWAGALLWLAVMVRRRR